MKEIMARYSGLFLVYLTILWSTLDALPGPEPRAETPYSFEDIFDPSLRPRGFSPTWIKGENAFYYRARSTGHVMKYNADTHTETKLVDNAYFIALNTGTYFMSFNLSYVLFAYDIQSLWRHSFNAKYKILNVETGDLMDFPRGELQGRELNYARWSPSSLALSFVFENNLYIQSSPTDGYTNITNDGDLTDVFNGVPDWLYEEDVLGDRVTHYWSPNSRYICYARIDASSVPFISWPIYGPKTEVYGEIRKIRYPKAGDVRDGKAGPNSVVNLFLIDLDNPNDKHDILPPTELADQDHYFVQAVWANDTKLYVTWTNRVQNYSHSVFYDVNTSPITREDGLVYNVTGGWVEVAPPEPIFIDTDTYITIHPRDRGATSGSWRQLAVYTRNSENGDIRHISSNTEEEVDYIYGYDSANNTVYYSSTVGDSTERHIVKVSLVEGSMPVCLTCQSPSNCRYITSSFSSSGDFYFLNCRGPEIPTYTLRSTLPGHENVNVVMENNSDVAERLAQRALPTRQFTTVPIGGSYLGTAEIFTPPGHVEGNKYPLLIYAYAGPGSQRVMKTFPMGSNTANWLTYLKSTHKVVVVSVDSRGASGRGDKFKFEMYRNLGTVEVQDQIAAGRYFGNQPIIDTTKSKAVFGWSYGGGTAAHVIGDITNDVTCGISVAPVTTKMYYDTAYTERYLGLATPDDDEAGYNNTDVMNKVENFRNKTFMLNHGIADDNVHYMHTTQLIQALANANIPFRQNAFIDQNHGISSPGAARYLYQSMTDFLLHDCWHEGHVQPNFSISVRHSFYLTWLFNLVTALLLRVAARS